MIEKTRPLTTRTSYAERFAEPRATRILRRVLLPFVALWLVLAAWSGVRAIVQVFRLHLDAPAIVSPGSILEARILSSARVPVTVRLELSQAGQTVVLGRHTVRTSRDAALDPRLRRGRLAVTLRTTDLARFAAGPATVRAVATGGSQFLRTPPPTVREHSVVLRP